MLGSLRLLEPDLDTGCSHIMVTIDTAELDIRGSWIRAQRGFLVEKSIPGTECYGQTDQQDLVDCRDLSSSWTVYCDQVAVLRNPDHGQERAHANAGQGRRDCKVSYVLGIRLRELS